MSEREPVVIVRSWTENNEARWELIAEAETLPDAREIIQRYKQEYPYRASSLFSLYRWIE